jgi:hypothetical protein
MNKKTISVEGLRPDQIKRLEAMRNDMLGWQFVGYAIAVGPDGYLWPNDTHGGEDKANAFSTPTGALEEFVTIQSALGDDVELSVVELYRNGDLWETVG